MLGDRLLAESVNLSPVLTAGWAGLIVNALNCLPTGGSPWRLVHSFRRLDVHCVEGQVGPVPGMPKAAACCKRQGCEAAAALQLARR